MSTIQNSLRSAVRGQVWLPGEPEFDVARRPWNVAIEQPAVAVVEAADADDVADLVRHARSAGVSIATQPSGHGASGSTEGTILLRTRNLDTLEVDPATRRARIGAGVRSGQVQAAAAPHGLTGLPGSSPVVNVTGSTIGGGISWFGRTRGWAADSVTAFDVVDAEGQQRHVTADSDPDLFWALRGAGGDLAIVTAIELSLHPVPQLYGGRVLWTAEHSAEVVEVYRQLTANAPNELTVWLDQLHFPGADPMVAVDATYLGAEDEARELLSALDGLPQPLSDSRKTMSSAELGAITQEPTDPSPGMSRGELLTEFSDDAVKALLAEPIAPLLSVQLRHLGGAFTQPSDSPHGPLTEPFLLYLFGIPADPAVADAIAAKQRGLAEALPVSGRKPFTFLNPEETAADAFSPEVLTRLRGIKRDQDPNNVFRSNFPLAAG
jgi:FAD/FMN-containing dehydrogenase